MGRRILAVVTDAYGARGGIAQYNRDLFQALAASADVVEILVLALQAMAEAGRDQAPAKVRQLPPRRSKLGFAYAALRLVRRYRPIDLIFCGHIHLAPLALSLSVISGAPLWLQLHGIEAWHRPGPLRRWAAERAHLVTAVSRHTRRRFLAWADCLPETVKVLPNTVDERFHPGPKPDALLEHHGLSGKQVLLTVSRLAASERYKGHDQVIRAVAALQDSHPDLVYVVAGDGDDRTRLERLAGTLGVSERVRFIGQVPDHELPDLYRAADLFVMPSTGEGFGIVFLEALASGVPAIGGDGDGSRDPLRDGHAGHSVNPTLPDALRTAIQEMLMHPRNAQSAQGPFARANFDGATDLLAKGFAVNR